MWSLVLHCCGTCALLLLQVAGITFRYVGELNRDEATRMLSNLPNGTFLIRVSNTASRRGEHALSIRFELLACLLNLFHFYDHHFAAVWTTVDNEQHN